MLSHRQCCSANPLRLWGSHPAGRMRYARVRCMRCAHWIVTHGTLQSQRTSRKESQNIRTPLRQQARQPSKGSGSKSRLHPAARRPGEHACRSPAQKWGNTGDGFGEWGLLAYSIAMSPLLARTKGKVRGGNPRSGGLSSRKWWSCAVCVVASSLQASSCQAPQVRHLSLYSAAGPCARFASQRLLLPYGPRIPLLHFSGVGKSECSPSSLEELWSPMSAIGSSPLNASSRNFSIRSRLAERFGNWRSQISVKRASTRRLMMV